MSGEKCDSSVYYTTKQQNLGRPGNKATILHNCANVKVITRLCFSIQSWLFLHRWFSLSLSLSLSLTMIQFSECTRYTGPAACLCEVWWTTPPVTLSTRYTVTNAVCKWRPQNYSGLVQQACSLLKRQHRKCFANPGSSFDTLMLNLHVNFATDLNWKTFTWMCKCC